MKFRRRKCRHCHEWFLPQPHNAFHQRFCTEPACRQASKRVSQRRWERKNPDHYRGQINVIRVQQWRTENPGYARGNPRSRRLLITVRCPSRSGCPRLRIDDPKTGALQDLFFVQMRDLHGVIQHLRTALQDFIGISAAFSYA